MNTGPRWPSSGGHKQYFENTGATFVKCMSLSEQVRYIHGKAKPTKLLALSFPPLMFSPAVALINQLKHCNRNSQGT